MSIEHMRSKDDSNVNGMPTSGMDTQYPDVLGSCHDSIAECFRRDVDVGLEQARDIGEADIVIGIPFYNEVDIVGHVVETAAKGLRKFYPNTSAVIVAVGSRVGVDALAVINQIPLPEQIRRIAFCFDESSFSGKGWSVRAICEISHILGADCVVMEGDLQSRENAGISEGLLPEWVYLLLEPIRMDKAELVISRFNRHYMEFGPNLLTYPLLTAIYNRPIHRLVGGQWAMSHRLLRHYLKVPLEVWAEDIGNFGVDVWTAINAIANRARIVESNLGVKVHKPSIAKLEIKLRQIAKVLFDQIVTNRQWVEESEKRFQSPFLEPLPIFGAPKEVLAGPIELSAEKRILKFRNGMDQYHLLYQRIFPPDVYKDLESLSQSDKAQFHFPNALWIQVVYSLLLAYAFSREFDRGDLLDSLLPLHSGLLAGLIMDMEHLGNQLNPSMVENRDRILASEARQKFEDLGNDFLIETPAFIHKWLKAAEVIKPPVPQITYREFVPGAPLIVPSEIVRKDGSMVTANQIYEKVFEKLKTEFDSFVHDRLNVSRKASSLELSLAIKDFLLRAERQFLPDIDLTTVQGTQKLVDEISYQMQQRPGFALVPERITNFLIHYPPKTLLTKLRFANIGELLQDNHPNDILALASWAEEREYLEGFWRIIREDMQPNDFASSQIEFRVVRHEDFPSLVDMKESSTLDRLAARVIVANLHKGMGGQFPKLHYFTSISRNIFEAIAFGRVWKRFAHDKSDFGKRVMHSIEGHWGREPLSAYAIFEAGISQDMLALVNDTARAAEAGVRQLATSAHDDASLRALIQTLRDISSSYNLSMIMPDGKFVTCSPWSWASSSFRGGKSSPTPLSLHTERDYLSREFLLEYYKAIGGSEEKMEETIIELMGQGRQSEDLASILLGTEKSVKQVVQTKYTTYEQPRAGMMHPYSHNPVLQSIKDHFWESLYVLNPGVVRLDDKVYMIYRAFGDDKISRLGLAISPDGFQFTERLDAPIFEPANPSEAKGCEDPRLTLMNGRIYMTYTAYDGIVAQVALASIGIEEFKQRQWDRWERHGLLFPGYPDKDTALFPEKFQGRYAMLHRVDPHIWITFSSHLDGPWPRYEHQILAGATPGMLWDGKKIGAGAQPIKTRYGWLLITHGVDFDKVYRLGVMLLDLNDPTRLIYRSPNAILEPEYRDIDNHSYWVPNVIFSCGALPLHDHDELLSAQDELIVYYGINDTTIGIATVGVGDLIPTSFR